MRKVRLGRSEIEVSELCLGTSLFGQKRLHLPDEQAAETVRKALELGVNFIDTSQYHQNYGIIRQALQNVEQDVVVMSRSFASDYEEMEKAIYEARNELQRDVVDLFLLHGVTDSDDRADRGWAWRALLDFKEAGAVRCVGVSSWTVPGVDTVLLSDDVEVVLVPFNEQMLGLHGGSGEELIAALRQLHERGVGVVASSVLGGGVLAEEPVEAIRYAREQPFIDAIRVNVRSVQELEAIVHIFNDEPVPADLQEAIRQHPRALHVLEWCDACKKCVAECPRDALRVTGWFHQMAEVDTSKCDLCGRCIHVCPVHCLRIF